MCMIKLWLESLIFCVFAFIITGCTSHRHAVSSSHEPYILSKTDTVSSSADLPLYRGQPPFSSAFNNEKYAARLPQKIDNPGHQKIIIVDPKIFAWGAYDEDGNFVRGGMATAGADYCKDTDEACRTKIGTFRIYSLGDVDCVSSKYPVGKGGSLMPYCMFFHKGLSLHGSPDQMMLSEKHISHGCVRLRIPDAEWLRYNFVDIGTKVVVEPY